MARRTGAFTVDHFRRYSSLLVYDDEQQREPDDWQIEVARDIFRGYKEGWLIVPEGNGKSTFIAQLALYGADYSPSPWIPVGASSGKQARIVYDQAEGFVVRTPGMKQRFQCLGGYILIRSLRNGGKGIEIFAHDPNTGDGVIPFPYAIIDELHRHKDLRLYNLWRGKLRKRGAQILTISTAGEPNTPFENMRDEIRTKATKRRRRGSHLRAEGRGLVFHEWMVPSDEACNDMAAVAAANPLSSITAETLEEDFDSPTLDMGNWKRLKCNRPTRSAKAAITDSEWDGAQTDEGFPAKAHIDLGLDVGWKWDTSVFTPLWCSPDWDPGVKADKARHIPARLPTGYRILGDATIMVPPRDGTSMHPDVIKTAANEYAALYVIDVVVMDMSRAEDIAAWLEDNLGVTVVDREQGNANAVADYDAFMEGLRNGTLKHTGHAGLREHAMNAIARRLPGGDFRFDRPNEGRTNLTAQDQRVIDGLTAAAMVVQHSTRPRKPQKSVYEDRFNPPPEDPPAAAA